MTEEPLARVAARRPGPRSLMRRRPVCARRATHGQRLPGPLGSDRVSAAQREGRRDDLRPGACAAGPDRSRPSASSARPTKPSGGGAVGGTGAEGSRRARRRATCPTSRKIRRMSDDAIVERLTVVRGIGRWTVEMFLIFRLGRPDVLPSTTTACAAPSGSCTGRKRRPRRARSARGPVGALPNCRQLVPVARWSFLRTDGPRSDGQRAAM